jgi:hypothetical protein
VFGKGVIFLLNVEPSDAIGIEAKIMLANKAHVKDKHFDE